MSRALVLLLSSLLACTGEPVVLAELAADAGASDGSRCTDNDDCAANAFCEKNSCGDAAGTCVVYPVSCGGESEPTCGCNGVTYFNACLRRAAGIAADAAGECAHGRDCDAPHDCPEGAECARLIGSDSSRCGGKVPGSCWVLPAQCGATADRWDSCDKDAICIDTCSAIRAGTPYARALRCN